jgi:hypothetical protein
MFSDKYLYHSVIELNGQDARETGRQEQADRQLLPVCSASGLALHTNCSSRW